MIIGLSGRAQVGKDTVGRILVEEYGFHRLSFADNVREVCMELDPIVDDGHLRLSHVVETYGWDYSKTTYPEVRRLLQVMGTEVGRKFFGETVWLDKVTAEFPFHRDIVVTDVRFPNEADAVRDVLGWVVEVRREGVRPVRDHASEVIDFEPDRLLFNTGTEEELRGRVKDLLDSIMWMS